MIKISAKWLSISARRAFKKANKQQFRDRLHGLMLRLHASFKGPYSYLLVSSLTFLLFSACFLDLGLPTILILSKEQAAELLNSRLPDLVNLFSISIVVAIFVIDASKARNFGEEQFSVLFKEAYLYPIVYFGLSIIGLLVVVSFFRYQLDTEVFVRCVVLGGYFFVGMLLCIGFLFVRIFKLVNSDRLLKAYLDEISTMADYELKLEILSRLSRGIYISTLKSLGFELDFLGSDKDDERTVRIRFQSNVVLRDVNLRTVQRTVTSFLKGKKSVGENKEVGFFPPLGIGDMIYQRNGVMRVGQTLKEKAQERLRRSYSVSRTEVQSREYERQKERLRSKLISAVKLGDLSSLESITDVYYSIHETFARRANIYAVEGKLNELPGDSWFTDEWSVLKGLDRHVFIAFESAFESPNREIILSLEVYVHSLLRMAAYENSLLVFQQYVYIPIRIYRLATEKTLRRRIADAEAIRLKELVSLSLGVLYSRAENIEKEKRINQFYYLGFTAFNALLKGIIDQRDHESFGDAMPEFKQLSHRYDEPAAKTKNDLVQAQIEKDKERIESLRARLLVQEQPQELYKAVVFGLQSWLWFLFRVDKIAIADLSQFSSQLEIKFSTTAESINDLLSYVNGQREPFGWGSWDTEERRTGEVIHALSPSTWLTFGFVVNILRQTKVNPDDLRDINEVRDTSFLIDEVEKDGKYLIENFEKWKIVFQNMDLKEIELRSSSLAQLFKNLAAKYQRAIDEEIVAQGLSKEKIRDYTAQVGNSWKGGGSIREVFAKFNAVAIETNDDLMPPWLLALNTNLIGGKMMFVEKHHQVIYGMEQYGYEMSRLEDIHFLLKLFQGKNDRHSFADALSAIEGLLAHRTASGLRSDLILIHNKMAWMDPALSASSKFNPDWRARPPLEKPFTAFFDGIPVVGLHDDTFENTVIVCDFAKAFKMRSGRKPEWVDEQLWIEVSEVSENDASRIYSESTDEWKLDNGRGMAKDEALFKIRKGVIIRIGERFEFVVKDSTAYDIGKVTTAPQPVADGV